MLICYREGNAALWVSRNTVGKLFKLSLPGHGFWHSFDEQIMSASRVVLFSLGAQALPWKLSVWRR